MKHIQPQSALAPEQWPFDAHWLPATSYLVGGCVRDALRGQPPPYLDLDFVLPQAPVETAQAIAQHYQAGFVLLDAERQIARVVFPEATADFALQMGPTLCSDLQRRDFTVNAIAYNPTTQELIDPCQGQVDLDQGLIRMVQASNLKADPLRLLRAYRQASQLGFTLDHQTRSEIRHLAPTLNSVAAERIRVELSYLLSHPEGTSWLRMLWQDALLQAWLPDITSAGLHWIAALDTATQALSQMWPNIKPELNQTLNDRAQGTEAARRTVLATTKLMGLLPQIPVQAKLTLQHLKYSQAEINLVMTLMRVWLQVAPMLKTAPLRVREQYPLFQELGAAFPAFAVLAIAADIPIAHVTPLMIEYSTPESAIAHPRALVSGKTLMLELNLEPGPAIGQLLADLALAQAEGKIATPEEAIALALKLSLKDSPKGFEQHPDSRFADFS